MRRVCGQDPARRLASRMSIPHAQAGDPCASVAVARGLYASPGIVGHLPPPCANITSLSNIVSSSSIVSFVNIAMRPCALLGLSVLASAATTPPTTSDHDQVIEVEGGREYTVKLKCAECPLRAWTSSHKAEWVHPPPESSLVSTLHSPGSVHN